MRRSRAPGMRPLLACALVLSLSIPGQVGAMDRPLWRGLPAGPHDVGFIPVILRDHSRAFAIDTGAAGHGRPIRMFVWYPATRAPGSTPVRYGDYVGLESFSTTPWDISAAQRRAGLERARSQSVDRERFVQIADALMAAPTAAFRDAPHARGAFPLLILGFGGTAPGYVNSVLCEFLASHGFVAASLVSLPRREGERTPLSAMSVDLQLRDVAFAISHFHEQPWVDRAHLGFVSLSASGIAHTVLQMQNPDVDVLVSLDGATGYRYGTEMIREAVGFDSTAVTVPYFHAHGLAPARVEVEKDFTCFSTWATGPACRLTFEHLSHPTFRSQAFVEHQFLNAATSAAVIADYRVLCETVLDFLDAYLRDAVGARDRLMRRAADAGVQVECRN